MSSASGTGAGSSSSIEIPGEAEPLTTAWWHNRLPDACPNGGRAAECQASRCGHASKWVKALSFSGSYESNFPVGSNAARPQFQVAGYHPGTSRRKGWEGDEHGHQMAIVLGKRYGYFADDVDDDELYSSEALLARFIRREHAISTRGDHWHALVWVPPGLRCLWPEKGLPGADIKGSGDGFIPVPGSVHYSGARYEPVPGARVITATEELLLAIRDQPVTERALDAGYTGGSADGRQGDLLRGLMRLPAGTTEDEAREWWLAEYERLDGEKDHAIDPDPAGLFWRHWGWRERKNAEREQLLAPQLAWAASQLKQAASGGEGDESDKNGALEAVSHAEPPAGDVGEDASDGGDGDDGGSFTVSLDFLSMRYTCDHFGMAEFFRDTFGSRVRWDEELQQFMVHLPEAGRWRQDGRGHEEVTRITRQLAKAVYDAAEEQITAQDIMDLGGGNRQAREAAQHRIDNLRRWYHVFKGTGNMASVVKAVQPTVQPCQRADFNRQPHLLNFTNGTYDVTTGELRPHRQDDLIAHQVPMALDITLARTPLRETAPHFWRLLTRMCAAKGELPAEVARERLEGVMAWCGYQLHGSNPEKRMCIFQGASQIGKNQVMEVIGTLLGQELAWLAARPQLLMKSKGDRHDTEEAGLAGRRLVLVNELLDTQVLDESQVLRFVNPDGALVSLRRLRHERIDAPVTWSITVTTNELPKADITPQIANRLLLFQLSNEEIPESERYDIKRAILDDEGPAVMAHLVRWWREWHVRWRSAGTGLIVPSEASRTLASYRDANRHPAELFIEECLVVEPGAFTSGKELWESCDAYYRLQHRDLDQRYLGGRRKFFGYLDELEGVERVHKKRGTQSPLLLGFDGVRLPSSEEELRLLHTRGAGRDAG